MTATISGDGTSTLINLTTSGNTVLGDASTDTLNVGNGGLVKDASGNVGIGTASPAYKLDVAQTSGDAVARVFANATTTSSRVEITNGDGTTALNYSYLRFINSKTSSQDWRFGTYGNNNLSFVNVTAGTTPMTLDSSGNLLVGTTSNSRTAKFRVYKSGDNVMETETDNAGTGFIHIGFINPNGRVGNISTSASATAYNTSSDYRLKEAISPMTGALAKVALLKPCTYKWKVDGSDGEGFIAHELAEVVSGCVTGEKDAVDVDGNPVYQGIDTSFLVATLTAAIQELKALVDTQASTITQLQADVEALKAQP